MNLNNPTVTKSGDSDGGDNCNFYGINSAIMATGGGSVSITGGTVTASATGANGIFSYGGNGGQNGAAGDGTTVYVTGTTINTTGDNGGGIMTTGGGKTVATNLTISTTGRSSAPIRTDRGGGNVTVSGGSYTSNGLGSPAVYSTADIVIENATLTSNQSEGVCIEGKNSVALTNCTLTANNTATNGQATFLDAIMIYQSMSGDSAEGTATFSMTGGTLINKSGHVFHVTNTNAIINLSNVTIDDSGDGILISVCDDGWSGASNVATLNASGQTLSGDILVGDDSTLTLNLTNSATFTGKIGGAITNASGSEVSSTVGTVNVSLDATSKFYLSEDTYISSFSGDAANVINNGFNLYVNNVILDGTTTSDDGATTATLPSGLVLSTDGSTLTAEENFSGTLIDLTNYPAVTTFDGEDSSSGLTIIGNSLNNSLRGSEDGVNTIWGRSGNNTLTFGSDYSDAAVFIGMGNDTVTDFASNDRVLLAGAELSSVTRNGSTVSITATNGNTLTLQTDSNSGLISYSADNENFFNANIADLTAVTINYSKNANYYALAQEGTLIVSGDSNEIHLDGSSGQGFFNVKDIIAITATGNNILAGDAKGNFIIGGTGGNSMWGGSDTATDILVGNDGTDIFYVGKAEGNDAVVNASSADSVNLYDATLDDIILTDEDDGTIGIAFKSGNVITVQSTDDLSAKFNLADGSSYRFNHATKSWQTE